MDTIDATRLKTHLGEALRMAAVRPVAIRKHGRIVALLVPPGELSAKPANHERVGETRWNRDVEERLLKLCAARDFRPSRWRRAGEPAFMAGLAATLGALDIFDRRQLFALAEALHPGASTVKGLQAWLEATPMQVDRFIPMLRTRLAHG